MNERPLGIITTRLPPHICGIGTNSSLLRAHWPGASRPVQYFVMEDGAEIAPDRAATFAGNGRLLSRALEEFGAGDLLLHYAARAYHRFGAPIWLPGVLEKWKRRFPASRLVIFFHELAGEAPITSRHYWLGRIDAHIVRRLVALADGIVTNTQLHAQRLQRIAGDKEVRIVPVGSNIPRVDTQLSRAQGHFVLMGLPFGRLQTLQWFDRHIREWIETGRLTQLHILGPSDAKFTPEADRLMASWTKPNVALRHGFLQPAEISPYLQRAQFALTNVSAETWSKSSAFMAYALNECPIVIRGVRPESGPLANVVGAAEVVAISDSELARRTAALAEWFRENADWPIIAERVAALFVA